MNVGLRAPCGFAVAHQASLGCDNNRMACDARVHVSSALQMLLEDKQLSCVC
jgi:hypothetical protein